MRQKKFSFLQNALEVKAIILSYARFDLRHLYVCTEIDSGVAQFRWDVGSVNKKGFVYEWEIKVDIGDFRKEFQKPKKWYGTEKHAYYLSGDKSNNYIKVPNFFVFVFCKSLEKFNNEIVKIVPEKYGIGYAEKVKRGFVDPYIRFVRRPKLLHDNVSEYMKEQIFMRMSSDLCRTYEKLVEIR
jgi:hypothetical protein